jgi:hypothetical protein
MQLAREQGMVHAAPYVTGVILCLVYMAGVAAMSRVGVLAIGFVLLVATRPFMDLAIRMARGRASREQVDTVCTASQEPLFALFLVLLLLAFA